MLIVALFKKKYLMFKIKDQRKKALDHTQAKLCGRAVTHALMGCFILYAGLCKLNYADLEVKWLTCGGFI